MKPFLFSLTLLLALGTLATRPALAQLSSRGPVPTAPVTTTPIDSGASLLLASGLALCASSASAAPGSRRDWA